MKANTAYEFKITAHNRIGASAPYYAEEPVVAGKRVSKYIFFFTFIHYYIFYLQSFF